MMAGDSEFLRRTFRDVPICRLATVAADGGPYVVPRWFVWLDDGLFVATRQGDSSWEHAIRDPRVSVVVDRGRDWSDLAGVRIEGLAEAISAEDPALRGVMSAWHEKYRSMLAGDGFERLTRKVPSLGFLRISVSAADSWDHGAA